MRSPLRYNDEGWRPGLWYPWAMPTYHDLGVWHEAQAFARRTHDLTDGAIGTKHPHIVLHLRQAAAAIPTNIAEGAAHNSRPHLARHLAIAFGAATECESHLSLLLDIRAIDAARGRAAADCLPPLRRQIMALHVALTAPTPHR